MYEQSLKTMKQNLREPKGNIESQLQSETSVPTLLFQ